MKKRTLVQIFGRLLKQKRITRIAVKRVRYSAYLRYKEQARLLVHERLQFWNRSYGFTYGRVSIRDQKTRWGSCSKKGNLNFNYKIVFLSPSAVDYLIVHELCHLKEFNHGRAFWELVRKTIPEYELQKNELRLYGKKNTSELNTGHIIEEK